MNHRFSGFFIAVILSLAGCAPNPFAELDNVLARKDEIEARLARKSDSLRVLFVSAPSDSLRWKYAEDLYEQWKHLNLDSCARYTDEMLCYAGDNPSRILRSRAALVRTLVRAGEMEEAVEVFRSLDLTDDAPEADFDIYYYTVNRLTAQLNAVALDSLGINFNEMADRYMLRCNSSGKSKLFKVRPLVDEDKLDEALALTLSVDPASVEDIYFYPTYFMTLVMIYNKMGYMDRVVENTMKAACVDISCGSKDYFSLYHLARLLFRQGDSRRAGLYMNRAVQDALDYNYPIGLKRSSGAASMMNEAIQQLEFRRRRLLYAAIGVISVFLLIALFLLSVSTRMLARVRSINRKYKVSQNALRNVSLIKDKMLGEYMELSSHYIYEVDQNKSRYRKILKEQGPEALMAIFREPAYADSEYPNYWGNFDKIFLSIFPAFIESVNGLMKPEHKFFTESDGMLTTQLRILALLRLGITESERIAAILHISKGTVYTYRCVMRQDSLCPETFEEAVGKLSDF